VDREAEGEAGRCCKGDSESEVKGPSLAVDDGAPIASPTSQRSRSSTSRCFQGYCLTISPARQRSTKFSAAGAAW